MTTQIKTLIYIAAIFLAGAATGGIVGACSAKRMMFLHPPRPHDLAEHLRFQLHSKLDLTPEQQRRIDPIVEQTGTELKAIHLEAMAKVAKAIDNTHVKIAAELTPEQRIKLEEMEKERREFLDHHPFGPPPPHGNRHFDSERPPDSAPYRK
jgi:Spy/CpxP family protein refolding chaperone